MDESDEAYWRQRDSAHQDDIDALKAELVRANGRALELQVLLGAVTGELADARAHYLKAQASSSACALLEELREAAELFVRFWNRLKKDEVIYDGALNPLRAVLAKLQPSAAPEESKP